MTHPERAAQMWAVLVLAARNRQVLTYDLMARATGVSRPGIGGCLGPIQNYCLRKKLPPLNVLVVSEKTGLPGEGCIAAQDIPQAQAEVFAFDWLAARAPTPKDFESDSHAAAAS